MTIANIGRREDLAAKSMTAGSRGNRKIGSTRTLVSQSLAIAQVTAYQRKNTGCKALIQVDPKTRRANMKGRPTIISI